LFLIDAVLTVVAVFQVQLAMQYEAVVTIVIQALDTAIILGLIWLRAGLLVIVASPVVSGCVGLIVAYLLVRRRFAISLSVEAGRVRQLLVDAAPVGLTTMIVVLYVKTDAVILGVLATSTDVGLFAAAYKPIEYALLALVLPINVLFPLLSRWHGLDGRLFRLVYWRGAAALLALTLPLVVVIFVATEPIVSTLYPSGFAPAAVPLRILALALPLMVLSAWQGFALLAGGHQRITVAYDSAALVLNVGLNLVLIPKLGYMGAALSALFTSLFVAVCAWTAATRRLDVRAEPDRRLIRVVLANTALALTLLVGSSVVPLWALVPLALGAYPVWLLLSGAVTRSEIALFIPVQRAAVPAAER
jgi:O-antigen/teichoic acid export membrane protein